MPELSQRLVNECASLVYSQWSKAANNLKAVKAERSDGHADWPLFHRERLTNATKELERWQTLLNEITPLHTIGKA